jgi:hypothetical protein
MVMGPPQKFHEQLHWLCTLVSLSLDRGGWLDALNNPTTASRKVRSGCTCNGLWFDTEAEAASSLE